MKKFKALAATAAIAVGAMASMGTTVVVGAGAYAVVGVAATAMDMSSAQARTASRTASSNSSRMSVSKPVSSPAPSVAPKPAVATPKPVTSNATPSSLATNSSRMPASSPATTNSSGLRPVNPKPAVPQAASASVSPKPMSAPTLSSDRSRIGINAGKPTQRYVPNSGMTRTWNSTPAQRASNGSIMKPLLIGAAAGLGTAMLYDWLTSPSSTVTTTSAPNVSATTGTVATNEYSTNSISSSGSNGSNLQVVKPAAEFKKFEGSEIPEKYKEIMKKQNLSIEAHEGATEYSKKIKTKSGAEVNVDVGEYPVLVIYMNSDGKPAEALFMPMK